MYSCMVLFHESRFYYNLQDSNLKIKYKLKTFKIVCVRSNLGIHIVLGKPFA